MSLDNIPEGFHQITITFKADDYVAGTKVIATMAILQHQTCHQYQRKTDIMANGRQILQ